MLTESRLKELFPHASNAFLKNNTTAALARPEDTEGAGHPEWPALDRTEDSCPESEPIICGEPEESVSDQKGSPGRYTLRIESRRCRLLDPDNLVGGVKFFVDSLRYFRVIPDDTAKVLRLIVFQTKVRSKAEEKTVITVIPPAAIL